jgi:hypothetical protein
VDIAIVLNFLGAIDGLDSLATVIGVTYWLGKSFLKIGNRFSN